MSNFTDQMQADAASVINEFATTITVIPYGLSSRTIDAVVTYGVPNPIQGSGGAVLTTDATLSIRKHATLGLASINIGGDVYTFPRQIGGADKPWKAIEIVSQDSAMFHVRVR